MYRSGARNSRLNRSCYSFFCDFWAGLCSVKGRRIWPQNSRPSSWKKGYCPVCGSFPHLAIIREKGQKWLQCHDCSHEWQFPRLACPYCEHEDPENTNVLFVEGKKEDTAYTCSKCRKYLVTSARSGDFRQIPADLIAISLAHLDLILQEKGFMPMAGCEGNSLETPCEEED